MANKNGEDTPPEAEPTRENPTPPSPAARAKAENSGKDSSKSAVEAERARTEEILSVGMRKGMLDEAREAIASDMSAIDFMRQVLEAESNDALSTRGADVGLTEREARSYSLIKVARYQLDPNNTKLREDAAFELECHDAQLSAGNTAERGGILVPPETLRAPLSVGTPTAAGNLVDDELMSGSFIDILRKKTLLLGMCDSMMGLVGDITIPGAATGAQVNWIGEDDDADETGATTRQIKLTPHTAAAYTELTRKFLKQSSIDGEAFMRRELAAAMGVGIDFAGLYGDPDGAMPNAPRGLAFTTGIASHNWTGADDKPSYEDVVELESLVAAADADVEAMAYLLNAVARGVLKTTQKFAGSNGAPVWETGNTVNGYSARVTNQVADGDVFFGNFRDLFCGMWGGIEFLADPYTHSKKGRLRITAFQDVDFVVRRVQSFVKGQPAP